MARRWREPGGGHLAPVEKAIKKPLRRRDEVLGIQFLALACCNTRLLLRRGTPKTVCGSFLLFLTAPHAVRLPIRLKYKRQTAQVQVKKTLLVLASSHIFRLTCQLLLRQAGLAFLRFFRGSFSAGNRGAWRRKQDQSQSLSPVLAACRFSHRPRQDGLPRRRQALRFNPDNRRLRPQGFLTNFVRTASHACVGNTCTTRDWLPPTPISSRVGPRQPSASRAGPRRPLRTAAGTGAAGSPFCRH